MVVYLELRHDTVTQYIILVCVIYITAQIHTESTYSYTYFSAGKTPRTDYCCLAVSFPNSYLLYINELSRNGNAETYNTEPMVCIR